MTSRTIRQTALDSNFSSQHYNNHLGRCVLNQTGQHPCNHPGHLLPLTQQNTRLLAATHQPYVAHVLAPLHAVPCYAMQCHAVPCCAMLCHAMPRCAMLCHAVPCCAMLCHAVLCCIQVSLDEAGASPGCAVLNPEGDLIVGRDEAFYFNTLEGRGPCFACEVRPGCILSCVSCLCAELFHMLPLFAKGECEGRPGCSISCVSCVCLTQR